MSPEPCRGILQLKQYFYKNQTIFLDFSFKFKETKHSSDDKELVYTTQTEPMKSLPLVFH